MCNPWFILILDISILESNKKKRKRLEVGGETDVFNPLHHDLRKTFFYYLFSFAVSSFWSAIDRNIDRYIIRYIVSFILHFFYGIWD